MKSFLNKTLLWGSVLLFLGREPVYSQPIPLIPQKEGVPQPLRPLASLQQEKGFWEGTPPSVIETYFSKLPLHLTSPLLRLMRAEVLKEKYTPLLQNTSYEKSLVFLLIGMGQFDQANEFLDDSHLPEKETLFLDLQWLTGKPKKACEKINNLLHTSPNAEWKIQNIYCLYLNGEEERGKIAAELLSESTPHISPLLNALFDSSSTLSFDPTIVQSPFLLTLWCEKGQKIPEDVFHKLSPASLSLIAHSVKMPLRTRLFAAEKGLQEGVIKGDFMFSLLQESSGHGLLEKLAQALKSPHTDVLRPLLQTVERDQKWEVVAEGFKSLLHKIEPSSDTLSLAPYIIRIFLAGGEKEKAQKWGTFFMREAPEEAIDILPLLHLAMPQNPWGDVQWRSWQAYQHRLYPEKAALYSYRLRRLLEALGEDSGPVMKGEPSFPSWRQEKALFDEKALALLDSAAESKRRGEVFLLTLVLIGETSLKDLPLDKFIPLLKILHKTGYREEARSLALEFLLANPN